MISVAGSKLRISAVGGVIGRFIFSAAGANRRRAMAELSFGEMETLLKGGDEPGAVAVAGSLSFFRRDGLLLVFQSTDPIGRPSGEPFMAVDRPTLERLSAAFYRAFGWPTETTAYACPRCGEILAAEGSVIRTYYNKRSPEEFTETVSGNGHLVRSSAGSYGFVMDDALILPNHGSWDLVDNDSCSACGYDV